MSSLDQLHYALDVENRLNAIRQEWGRASSFQRHALIRRAYSLKLPSILSHGCDPYFLEWQFTPIEELAWQDIRGQGLRLYPQFPAGRFFVDFADPVLQIGVELDGAAYHSEAKDRSRDEELWSLVWRIFRIPGRESLPAKIDPRDVHPTDWSDDDERIAAYHDWAMRWSTGFFAGLKRFYYDRGKQPDDCLVPGYVRALNAHRYVNFPLELDMGRAW